MAPELLKDSHVTSTLEIRLSGLLEPVGHLHFNNGLYSPRTPPPQQLLPLLLRCVQVKFMSKQYDGYDAAVVTTVD